MASQERGGDVVKTTVTVSSFDVLHKKTWAWRQRDTCLLVSQATLGFGRSLQPFLIAGSLR